MRPILAFPYERCLEMNAQRVLKEAEVEEIAFEGGVAFRAEAPGEFRALSDFGDASPTQLFAVSATRIERPVSVAKSARGLGLSLREAHDAPCRLAERENVVARFVGEGWTVRAAVTAVGLAAGSLQSR